MKCVNYGCGFTAPIPWVNYDASMTLRFERILVLGMLYTKNEKRFPDNVKYGDIVRGLPLKEESVDAIFCSHMLEHLSLHGFRRALRNTYKILKKGGVFRLVVPDLRYLAEIYLNSDNADASIQFVKNTLMGEEVSPKGFLATLFSALGNSKHLWMWDYKSIKLELESTGFVMVRKCKYGDAENSMFKLVEEKDRFAMAVCVESKK